MRFLAHLLLAAGITDCDVEQGAPLYNNPPPGWDRAIQDGQRHTDCPSGYTFC